MTRPIFGDPSISIQAFQPGIDALDAMLERVDHFGVLSEHAEDFEELTRLARLDGLPLLAGEQSYVDFAAATVRKSCKTLQAACEAIDASVVVIAAINIDAGQRLDEVARGLGHSKRNIATSLRRLRRDA